MTPGETIRKAAAKMRAEAAAADTGEAWEAGQHYGLSWLVDLRPSAGPVSNAPGAIWEQRLRIPGCDESEDPRFVQMFRFHAEHVASWHPAIGRLVADLLEREAVQYDLFGAAAQQFLAGEDGGDLDPAFVLARTYLGEAP